jgi:hypothetical protein
MGITYSFNAHYGPEKYLKKSDDNNSENDFFGKKYNLRHIVVRNFGKYSLVESFI